MTQFGSTPPGYGAPPPPPPSPWAGVTPEQLLPSAPPRRRRWPLFVGVFAAIVVLGAIAAGVFAFANRGPDYPSHWDASVAPIATEVEAFRGLTFKHPVPVKYLSVAEFEKKVTSDPEDLKKQHDEIEQVAGLFRAAGLIGGDVDLAQAANDTQAADTIAFYDPDTKAVYVRGTGAFTIETRVTLAHELTHVLQDQYFDLKKLQKQAADSKTGSSDAFTALVEGDAVRIEDAYLAAQSAAERKDYGRLSSATNADAGDRTKDLPAVLETLFGAPYIFGPQIIGILEDSGGNEAINAALTGPTPTTRMYLDPTALNETPALPAIPKLQAGEKRVSSDDANDDAFDDFTLYLMLGARLDRLTALRAADAYASGSEVLYTRGGKTCFRAAIEGTNLTSEAYLRSVLKQWTAAMPDAGIDADSSAVVFHSCDPGTKAAAPSNAAIKEATSFAVNRAALTKELVTKEHATIPLAVCFSRLFFESPTLRGSLFGDTSVPADRLRSLGASVGLACRANPSAGLP